MCFEVLIVRACRLDQTVLLFYLLELLNYILARLYVAVQARIHVRLDELVQNFQYACHVHLKRTHAAVTARKEAPYLTLCHVLPHVEGICLRVAV